MNIRLIASRLPSPIRWLFTPLPSPSPGRAILWWELRRIPVNLLIGVYGIVCLLIFYAVITHSPALQPGEDAVEPLAVILAPIAFNVCYTLGWLVETSARALAPRLTPKLGPRLLFIGLVFSLIVVTSIPILLAATLFVGRNDRYTVVQPAAAELVGTYYPTDATRSLITRLGGYASGPGFIRLQSDGTFQFENIPDCWRTEFGTPAGGMDSGTGVWKTEKHQDRWILQLTFDNQDHFSGAARSGGFTAEAELIGQHAPHDIALIVGDPDEARQMRFSRSAAATRP